VFACTWCKLRFDGQGFHYDPFRGLASLDHVEHFTRQLLGGSADMGPLNAYWEEARRGLLASSLISWQAPLSNSRSSLRG
jgi:hypothetical protein